MGGEGWGGGVGMMGSEVEGGRMSVSKCVSNKRAGVSMTSSQGEWDRNSWPGCFVYSTSQCLANNH